VDSATKTLVQSQFGQNAARYATSRVHAEGESLGRLVEAVQPRADWRALDIATGPGHTAFAFAAQVNHVVASDLTPEMLQVARGLAAQRGLSNVSFAEAQAENLPFADGSFDLVTCRTAPHHFADVAAFVREAARVLRPGGVFGLVDNISPNDAQAAADYNAFEKLRDPSHGRCLSESEWLDLIAGAGLVVRHREILTKDIELEGWAGRMQAAPATKDRLRAILRGASLGLRDFLQPKELPDNIGFVLMESLIAAEKPPAHDPAKWEPVRR
jgi:ubiquinone/menaquinone biosynthesis C-methylase UbiE